MKKEEALNILVEAFNNNDFDRSVSATCNDTNIMVHARDIIFNIECKGDLDTEWIQDFNQEGGIFQGWSLDDVELI